MSGRPAPDYRRYPGNEVPEDFDFSINPDNPTFPDEFTGEWSSPTEDFNPEDTVDGGTNTGSNTGARQTVTDLPDVVKFTEGLHRPLTGESSDSGALSGLGVAGIAVAGVTVLAMLVGDM